MHLDNLSIKELDEFIQNATWIKKQRIDSEAKKINNIPSKVINSLVKKIHKINAASLTIDVKQSTFIYFDQYGNKVNYEVEESYGAFSDVKKEVVKHPKFKTKLKELNSLNESVKQEVKRLSQKYEIPEVNIWKHLQELEY